MKKRCVIITIIACCSLVGCGATTPEDTEESTGWAEVTTAPIEQDNAAMRKDIDDLMADNAAIKADIAELEESQTSDAATENVSPSDDENETTVEAKADKPYKDGAPAEIVEDEDVIDYYVPWSYEELWVMTNDGMELYTGEETPAMSWRIENMVEAEWFWSVKAKPDNQTLLIKDKIIALEQDGTTEVLFDHVVDTDRNDSGTIRILMIEDGVLSFDVQFYDTHLKTRTEDQYAITDGVEYARLVYGDEIEFLKGGKLYYYKPLECDENGVTNEDRLLAGDTSVIECLSDV